ncbi:MAG: PilN domain-containing protein, partial [Pirellulales bacterium]|nr:PilN domain-containing protein [Pirellulales bacterium]
HYMGLGRGEKATASVVHSVDAREERATIAVAVDSTLELLIEVSQRLGVELETVEPSAVALARLCGYLKLDGEQPVALIAADDGGTDLVLSYQGEVLLHHRLGVPLSVDGEVERIRRQLCLLAQHAGRYADAARKNDLPVYVVTQGQAEDQLIEQLIEDDDVKPCRLDWSEALPTWQWESKTDEVPCWPAIGGCLRPYVAEDAAPAPDMVHNLTGTAHLKLMQARRKMWFPLIAAGLVGIAVGFAAFWESSAAAGLEENLKRFDTVKQDLELAKMQLMRTKRFNTSTEAIAAQVSGIDWRRELDLLAECKPKGVWLKRVTLRQDGTFAIAGVGETDTAIYEFKEWLAKAPPFSHVELISTRAGPRTDFEMECEVRGRGGY